MCTQSHALGTSTKFQLEIPTINVFSGSVYFRESILESSRNVSETTPRASAAMILTLSSHNILVSVPETPYTLTFFFINHFMD